MGRDGLSAFDPHQTLSVRRSSSVNAAGRPNAAPVKCENVNIAAQIRALVRAVAIASITGLTIELVLNHTSIVADMSSGT